MMIGFNWWWTTTPIVGQIQMKFLLFVNLHFTVNLGRD
jgi:hypothetical protein